MKKTARHHHYLPQCYLRGFTKPGEKKSKLTVIDLKRRKRFKTNTRNVGGIRDFNRIEIDGIEPDAIEKSLSSFEGHVASSLLRIRQTLAFDGKDRECILNLIALLAVRSPEKRENWRKFQADIAERITDLSLATKERWESQKAKMKKDGYEVNEDITYEELKEFKKNKEYTISVPTEHHLQAEFAGMDAVLSCLSKRKWLLILATKDTGPLVTTDNPVVLTWNEPEKMPPLLRQSPGHGMRDTQVLFPIYRNLSLLGEFEGKEGTIEGTKELIMSLNTRMIEFAFQQIYAPIISFNYMGPNRKICDGTTILTLFKRPNTVPSNEEG